MASEIVLKQPAAKISRRSSRVLALVVLVGGVILALKHLGFISLNSDWVPAFGRGIEGSGYEVVDFSKKHGAAPSLSAIEKQLKQTKK